MEQRVVSFLAWLTLTALVTTEPIPQDDLCHQPPVLKYGEPSKVFEEWKQTYGYEYENDWDDEHRFKIFQQNLAEIESHNRKYHAKQSTFYMGLNQFSAMTKDEFLRYTRQGRYSLRSHNEVKVGQGRLANFKCEDADELKPMSPGVDLPKTVNWTEQGYVTPVKDQGQCGSCWAFSATGAVEGAYYAAHEELVSFSEQQIIDCCHREDCNACHSGDQEAAYATVYDEGGIETEESYPYRERKGRCRFNKTDAVGHIKSCKKIHPPGDELELQRASATLGPISVSVDASNFHLYEGGVFNDTDCSTEDLDHAVLLTGYGTDPESKLPYWMIKNSWSQNWGCHGYIYLLRNNNNMCGIATDASYVVMR
ncbi:hypothetical protein Btru_050025 [Bulinus truncatus]|nr:hypothetical protein Btru_050025 [Bulinus truncatus]